jgi:predicted ester cyclase
MGAEWEESEMPSQTEESKALLRRITREIWNDGRLDLIDQLIGEDFVDHLEIPGVEGTGRERYRASVTAVHAAFPDYREEILWSIGEGDRAVSYVLLTGTHTGPLYGIEPTGRKVEYNAMGALRFARGRARERWGLGDSTAMMRQLGV